MVAQLLGSDEMITVKNLTVSYYGKEAVSDVSFSCQPGSLIGIIGPNGSGKSTMIKAILGIIPKDRGQVLIEGKPATENLQDIAYVQQKNDIDWDFPINVLDTVLMGTYPNLGLFKRPKQKQKQMAKESLDRVGMLDYAHRQIGELSGGQQQRVFLARALAQQAKVFFLDEPFVGIDIVSEERIIKILRELKAEGKTLFIVNHDLSKTEAYFDELILLNKSLVAAGPVRDVYVYDTITKAYKANFDIPRATKEESV